MFAIYGASSTGATASLNCASITPPTGFVAVIESIGATFGCQTAGATKPSAVLKINIKQYSGNNAFFYGSCYAVGTGRAGFITLIGLALPLFTDGAQGNINVTAIGYDGSTTDDSGTLSEAMTVTYRYVSIATLSQG